MLIGQPGKHPTDLGQVCAAGAPPTDQQRGQCVALGGHPLGLRERLADQSPSPQREPPGDGRVAIDRLADRMHRKVGPALVLQHLGDQSARAGVEVGRDLAVEVGGDAVADIGLDQPFEPDRGPRAVVEGVHRLDERLHRSADVGADALQPLVQQVVVVQHTCGLARQLGLVRQRGRQVGVSGQSAEGGQLAVRHGAQQVDHRLTVRRVSQRAGTSIGGLWRCGHTRERTPGQVGLPSNPDARSEIRV